MLFRNLLRSSLVWFGIAGLLVLAFGIGFTAWQWQWLHEGDPSTAASTTLRNMGLLIGGGIAAVFAIWRGWVAERQSATSQRQADIADQNLLNERYQRGAEMLGDEVLSVRMAGIYALQRLAEEHLHQYHIQIMQLFCAFIRHPTQSDHVNYSFSSPYVVDVREDVTEAVQNIRRRTPSQIEIERRFDFVLDLHESDLRRQLLMDADLSRANLLGANLSGAILSGSDLSEAQLAGAIFSDQSIGNGKTEEIPKQSGNEDNWFLKVTIGGPLSRNFLFEADLSGALFSIWGDMPALGLLQENLDFAYADPENPPILEGAVDADSGQQLVWNGKAV